MGATVGEVIELAVGLAKLDATFYPLARRYYNRIIRAQSRDFDWPFYREVGATANFIQGQTAYTVPADYSRSDFCYYMTSQGKQGAAILITSPMKFEQIRAQEGTVGVPRVSFIDVESQKIHFESAPSSGGYKLSYFRKGTEVATDGADDGDQIDFQDDNFLIAGIQAMLMDYSDDDRQDQKSQMADKLLVESKRNVYDEDDDPTVEMARAKFVGGRRPTRGGGGFFGD